MAVSFDRELNDLDRGITALRIDYERFFGGELRRPPVAGRRTLEETLRRLGNAEVEKAPERFRLQTLQSRYNSFAELWDKRMQAREEGRTGPIRRLVPLASVAGATSGPNAAPDGKSGGKKQRAAEAPDIAALLAAAEKAVGGGAPARRPAPSPRRRAPLLRKTGEAGSTSHLFSRGTSRPVRPWERTCRG